MPQRVCWRPCRGGRKTRGRKSGDTSLAHMASGPTCALATRRGSCPRHRLLASAGSIRASIRGESCPGDSSRGCWMLEVQEVASEPSCSLTRQAPRWPAAAPHCRRYRRREPWAGRPLRPPRPPFQCDDVLSRSVARRVMLVHTVLQESRVESPIQPLRHAKKLRSAPTQTCRGHVPVASASCRCKAMAIPLMNARASQAANGGALEEAGPLGAAKDAAGGHRDSVQRRSLARRSLRMLKLRVSTGGRGWRRVGAELVLGPRVSGRPGHGHGGRLGSRCAHDSARRIGSPLPAAPRSSAAPRLRGT
jgi:hypothetical protein